MKQLSTQNLNLLPQPNKLKQICKAISALEAIISPEWENRYYSYQKDWDENGEFCEMRNGEGDQMQLYFSNEGTCINGFAVNSQLNGWKNNAPQIIASGIVNDLPTQFHDFIFSEPVKSIGTTFCIWQGNTQNDWSIGKIELPEDDYKDGSADLLQLLDGKPSTFKNWAEEYYEENFEVKPLELSLIHTIYEGKKITKEFVSNINPTHQNFDQLKTDLDEIGFTYQLP